jgi:UDP-N-acetylglucosamine 4,6-dehydratase
MKNVLSGKTVLVTGGTGSIGTEIVRQALAQGANKVVVFSRDEIKHFLMKKRIADNRLETIIGDVRNLRSVERVFTRVSVDIIYHAAAMKHVVMCEDFPLEAVETNIVGTQNLVDLAMRYGVSKMLTISTDKAAYPVNIMGATKFIAERITLNANEICKSNQAFSCVRFGNVASSRGSVIPVYIDNLLNRIPLQVTDPEVTRFVMEIPEAVKLIITATGYAQGREIFILKMKAFRLGDLVAVILDGIAPRLNIAKESVELNVIGLVPGEKLHEDLINDAESSRICELDDMYVVLPDNESYPRLANMRSVSLPRYTSRDVELISRGEIEEIVVKYLKNRWRDLCS